MKKKVRYVSVFSDPDKSQNHLWRLPEIKKRSDITDPILMKANLYKLKDECKMDPKFFILTKNVLYYTYVEQSEDIQGALDLRWLLVEFEEPPAPKQSLTFEIPGRPL